MKFSKTSFYVKLKQNGLKFPISRKFKIIWHRNYLAVANITVFKMFLSVYFGTQKITIYRILIKIRQIFSLVY